MSLQGCREIKIYIMSFIEDDLQLIQFCSKTPKYCSDNFILNRLYDKFNITPEEVNTYKGESYLGYYARLITTVRSELASYHISMALRYGRTDLAKVAARIGTPGLLNEILIHVSLGGYADLLKLILRNLGPNASKPQLDLALYASIFHDNSDMINALLDAGADIHYNNGAIYGAEACLMRAILSNHPNIVKLLIDRGADIHANNNHAFNLAGHGKTPEILALLKEAENNEKIIDHINCFLH